MVHDGVDRHTGDTQVGPPPAVTGNTKVGRPPSAGRDLAAGPPVREIISGDFEVETDSRTPLAPGVRPLAAPDDDGIAWLEEIDDATASTEADLEADLEILPLVRRDP